MLFVVLGAALVLGGCATPDRTPRIVDTALDEASSAVEVASLVVGLVADGRATRGVADTALLDVIDDVGIEQASLAEALPADPRAGAARDEAARAVADAAEALAHARAWVAGTSDDDATTVRERLDAVARSLDEAGA